MRIAIYSCEGSSLSWQRRLMDEGHEVLVYHPARKGPGNCPICLPGSEIGKGIVPLTYNLQEWTKYGMGNLYLFDSSGHGDFAQSLISAGQTVIGAGAFCDKLEDDRPFGMKIAKDNGIKSPQTYFFHDIPTCITFLTSHPGKWYFKSNKYLEAGATYSEESKYLADYLQNYITPRYGSRISCILQAEVEGFALSTARWWNGKKFVGPYEGSIEHKKFMAKDIGGATGCSFNYLWYYQDEEPSEAAELKFDNLAPVWRYHKAPPGIYDINALVAPDGTMYFLEWTPRMGYDAQPTSARGISNLGAFLEALAYGGEVDSYFNKEDAFGSVRLSASPYPFEHTDEVPREKLTGLPVRGTDGFWKGSFVAYGLKIEPGVGLCMADPHGIVGLVVASGDGPELFKKCYKAIKDLHIPALQYRPDAEECVEEDLETITEAGHDTR